MGEAELTTNAIEVGDGGMATALEFITTRVRGEDGSLEGRSMPKGEQEGTLIGWELDKADADREMVNLVDAKKARTGLLRKECTIVAKEMALVGGRSGSAAIDLAP